MKTEHTPGPWIEFRDAESHDIIAPDGVHIARMEPRNGREPQKEQDADARLIAAAPELLAALAGMLEWARRVKGRNPGPEIAEAQAAIAKAEGRNP